MPTPAFGSNSSGIKAMIDQIHGMGLKVGLYGAASAVTCGKSARALEVSKASAASTNS